MFARVTTVQADPHRLDDGIRLYQESADEFRDQLGFTEAVLLVNATSGDCLSITIWENADALARSMNLSKSIAQRTAEVLRNEPQRASYEVLEHHPGEGKVAARVSTIKVRPDWFDRPDARRDTSIITAARKQPGYRGFLILGNRLDNLVLGMSFWDSLAHLERSESPKGYYQQEMERARDQWAGGWKRDVYEVVVEF